MYRATLDVPEAAYELNFVFSNGEGVFDNNATLVRGGHGGGGGVGVCVSSARAAFDHSTAAAQALPF